MKLLIRPCYGFRSLDLVKIESGSSILEEGKMSSDKVVLNIGSSSHSSSVVDIARYYKSHSY